MSKLITLPDYHRVNQKMVDRLSNFIDGVRPNRLKDSITSILLQYLVYEHHSLPMDFDEVACDLYILFDFLDALEKELQENVEPLN